MKIDSRILVSAAGAILSLVSGVVGSPISGFEAQSEGTYDGGPGNQSLPALPYMENFELSSLFPVNRTMALVNFNIVDPSYSISRARCEIQYQAVASSSANPPTFRGPDSPFIQCDPSTFGYNITRPGTGYFNQLVIMHVVNVPADQAQYLPSISKSEPVVAVHYAKFNLVNGDFPNYRFNTVNETRLDLNREDAFFEAPIGWVGNN